MPNFAASAGSTFLSFTSPVVATDKRSISFWYKAKRIGTGKKYQVHINAMLTNPSPFRQNTRLQIDQFSVLDGDKFLNPDDSGLNLIEQRLAALKEKVAEVSTVLSGNGCAAFAVFYQSNDPCHLTTRIIDLSQRFWERGQEFWAGYEQSLRSSFGFQKRRAYKDLFLILGAAHDKREALTHNQVKNRLTALEQLLQEFESRLNDLPNSKYLTLGKINNLVAEANDLPKAKAASKALPDLPLTELLKLLRFKLTQDADDIGRGHNLYSRERPTWGWPLDSEAFWNTSHLDDKRSENATWNEVTACEDQLEQHFLNHTGDQQAELSCRILLTLFESERKTHEHRGLVCRDGTSGYTKIVRDRRRLRKKPKQ